MLILIICEKVVIDSKSFFITNQKRKKLSEELNDPLNQGTVYKVYKS